MATNPTLLPPFSLGLINSDGSNNDIWYRFFNGMWNIVAASSTATLPGIETQIRALNNSQNIIEQTAALALTTAQQANTASGAAQTTATAAQNTANTAIGNQINFLRKNSNLSDVASVPISRTNLELDTFAVNLSFDTVPSGLTRNVPLIRAYNMPSNFAGTLTYCSVFPTTNAIFTVNYVRSGVVTTIGTITLIHSGNYSTLAGSAVTLLAGDTLQVVCPAIADATLAQLGITLKLLLA